MMTKKNVFIDFIKIKEIKVLLRLCFRRKGNSLRNFSNKKYYDYIFWDAIVKILTLEKAKELKGKVD